MISHTRILIKFVFDNVFTHRGGFCEIMNYHFLAVQMWHLLFMIELGESENGDNEVDVTQES